MTCGKSTYINFGVAKLAFFFQIATSILSSVCFGFRTSCFGFPGRRRATDIRQGLRSCPAGGGRLALFFQITTGLPGRHFLHSDSCILHSDSCPFPDWVCFAEFHSLPSAGPPPFPRRRESSIAPQMPTGRGWQSQFSNPLVTNPLVSFCLLSSVFYYLIRAQQMRLYNLDRHARFERESTKFKALFRP